MNYKIKRIGWSVLFMVLVAACSKVPRKYIQPDEMKMMMWEMMFADKKITDNGGSIFSFPDSLTVEYSKVLAYHNVSQEKFVESLRFYQSDPQLQKALYDSIYNYGNRMLTEVQERVRVQDSINAEKRRVQDSINLANQPEAFRKDSLRRDSLRKDSIRLDSIRRDSTIRPRPLRDSIRKVIREAAV